MQMRVITEDHDTVTPFVEESETYLTCKPLSRQVWQIVSLHIRFILRTLPSHARRHELNLLLRKNRIVHTGRTIARTMPK